MGRKERSAFFIPRSGLIGHETIDAEHAEVVEALEEVRAHLENRSYEHFKKTQEICDLLQGHFRSEEKIMAAAEFPHLETHVVHHDQSLGQIYRILGNAQTFGEVTINDLQDIYRNLLSDIFTADGHFSAYTKTRDSRLIERDTG